MKAGHDDVAPGGRSFSLPIVPILLLLIVALTLFLGWIVPVIVVVLGAVVTVGTALHDRLTHDRK